MKMNLPNKLTMARIAMAFLVIIVLLFPFEALGIDTLNIFINETIIVNIKYIIAGILFILASITDFLDGYIARKYNLITDFGKMMDAMADKILVNSILIILSATGFVHPIITVVIVVRDSITNSIKMACGNKGKTIAASNAGKLKTVFLMVGIALTLFYNLPFELWNFKVSEFLLIIAAVLSIISGIEYYNVNKKMLFDEMK